MMTKRLTIIVFIFTSPCASAGNWADGLNYTVRLGYSVGGTMPPTMPAEIRSLDTYKFCCNPQIAVSVGKTIVANWGVMSGLHLEQKGMKIDATVKNYHIQMEKGGEQVEGQFTGHNYTEESQMLLTLPIMAAYQTEHLCVYAGVYGSLVLDARFEGYAYDGYLRQREDGMAIGDPTGARIELGSTPTERGEYDFAEDMRRLQYGIMAGADCFFGAHWGVYANLNYGLCGIHKSSFKTLDQKLHAIYGTIGIAYKL